MSGKCSSCGAAIFWERTKNGKHIPVDAAPSPDGNIEMRGGIAHVVGDELPLAPRFKSHFATCPNAAQHRKAKP